MKNQYFGDVSDYKKYSLLRTLSNYGDTKIIVGWMLTEDDGRTDGKFIRYLQEPIKWRRHDPQVFDLLCYLINQKDRRDVRLLEKEAIIPSATYYTDIITDNIKQREEYFENLRLKAEGHHLVFLDPDNGIEVKSTLKGAKNSSKYLYWDEIANLFYQGFSLLIYQHFSRVKREPFIQSVSLEIMSRTNAEEVYSFQTSHVVFFLVPQFDHRDRLGPFDEILNRHWSPQIQVAKYTRDIKKTLSDVQLSLDFDTHPYSSASLF